MNTTTWVCGLVLAGLVVLAGPGCKKQEVHNAVPTVNGVKVDFPKLQHTFAQNTNRELQKTIIQVNTGLRYGKPMDALEAMDKLKSEPNLTDEEKKVVDEVLEQVKQVAEKSQAQ